MTMASETELAYPLAVLVAPFFVMLNQAACFPAPISSTAQAMRPAGHVV